MKKLFLSFSLLCMMVLCGFAQNLSLSNASGPIAPNATIVQAGTPDSVELITYFNVKNTGSSAIDVLCKKVEIAILDSTEVTICWAGGCYPATTFVSPNYQPMAAGETNTEFVGHYTQIAFNHFKPGESIIRWVFYNRSNPNDSVSATVKYTSYPLGMQESPSIAGVLSGPSPNPASREAGFTYSFQAGSNGMLLVRDVIGSTVQSVNLASSAGHAVVNTLNLRNGIYFCTLLVNGNPVQTRKMIVKH